jgi:sialate O-acetylesterase
MRFVVTSFFLLLSASVFAQLEVDQSVMHKMVLQRGEPLILSGKALPSNAVKISIGEIKTYTTVSNQNGFWKIEIPSHTASVKPFSLVVFTRTDSLQFRDLLWGDVWVCAGQSNMEFALKSELHYQKELPIVINQNIRVYNPVYIGKNRYANPYPDTIRQSITSTNFYQGVWQTLDSISAPSFSAIGYYFAKIVAQTTGVPIGIINVSVGGSPIEAWMSKASLESDTAFSKKINGSWLTNDYLPVWIRQRGKENIGLTNLNGNHAFKPSFLYDAAIEPLSKLKIAGMLWYQGESNAQELQRVEEYASLQEKMIASYRSAWGLKNLPFYFVQLSSIDSANYKSHHWQQFRAVQFEALQKGHHVGMVVSMDKGAKNDVHPTNKKDIAQRLANTVLHDMYGYLKSPTLTKPIRIAYANEEVVVTFNNPLQTIDGAMPKGFSLDGIHEVNYVIMGNKAIIKTPSKPARLYFGFSPYTSANLVDKEGIPIPAFILPVQ